MVICGLSFLLSPSSAIAQNELFRTDLLIDAITTNDYELANSTLIKGHNPDPVDNYGRTPLIIAAMAGNPDLVELLAEYKAKLNRGDKAGGTALHYAAHPSRPYRSQARLRPATLRQRQRSPTRNWQT